MKTAFHLLVSLISLCSSLVLHYFYCRELYEIHDAFRRLDNVSILGERQLFNYWYLLSVRGYGLNLGCRFCCYQTAPCGWYFRGTSFNVVYSFLFSFFKLKEFFNCTLMFLSSVSFWLESDLTNNNQLDSRSFKLTTEPTIHTKVIHLK